MKLRHEAQTLFAARLETITSRCSEREGIITATEDDVLQRLYASTLQLPLQSIQIHLGWSELGGDSLLAMKLIDGARAHGIRLSVFDVMECDSLAELRSRAEFRSYIPASGAAQPFVLLPIEIESRDHILGAALDQCHISTSALEDLYPCTALQHFPIPRTISRQVNLTLRLRCQLPADLDQRRFVRAWDNTISANPILRTRIIEAAKGDYYQAVIRDPIALHPDADLVHEEFSSVDDIFAFGEPLVRAYFHDRIFVTLIHHCLLDGYSFPLIFREIERAYYGETLRPLSYSTFVAWSSRFDDENTQFWSGMFAGYGGKHFPPVPPRNYDALETAQLQRQLQFSSKDGFTPSNKLRLALAVTYARNLCVDRVVFGIELARRAAPIQGISSMSVPTAAILPVCIRLDMHDYLRSNVQQVQSQAAQMVDFEGVDTRLLRGLDGRARSACDYQTVLIVQAEGTDTFSGIFSEAKTEYGNALGIWSLCLECWLSSNSLVVKVRIDENVLDKERATRFLDCFELVFDLISNNPGLNPADIEAQFDF